MQTIPLFDLGNVIIKVDFDPFVKWLAERSESKDLAKAQGFLRSSLFYDFEFGNIGRDEFARRVAALYRADFTQAELEFKFCDIFSGAVEGMVELLGELAADRPVYALSNTNELHLAWIWERHPEMLRPFKTVFASHEIHKRKPYPGIYHDVADLLGVAPQELIFFDDLHPNVEGALKAGLEAHVFAEAGQVRALLKRN